MYDTLNDLKVIMSLKYHISVKNSVLWQMFTATGKAWNVAGVIMPICHTCTWSGSIHTGTCLLWSGSDHTGACLLWSGSDHTGTCLLWSGSDHVGTCLLWPGSDHTGPVLQIR